MISYDDHIVKLRKMRTFFFTAWCIKCEFDKDHVPVYVLELSCLRIGINEYLLKVSL